MAGRPAKILAQHVRDGSFRPHRHGALLSGPDLVEPGLALLQARYRRAATERERGRVVGEFAQALRLLQQGRAVGGGEAGSLAAALARFGKPNTHSRLVRFFPAAFAHPKGPLLGQQFRLEPWQQRFLKEFYRRDGRGRRVYRTGVLGVPRGNGKTPFAAGLAVYELLSRSDAPEVYFAAGSKEQAGIGFGFARAFVENGFLADWVTVTGGALACAASRGELRLISSEGRLQHGRAPSVSVVDELWTFETSRQEQTYVSLASALHKREDAYLLAITTAGYNQHGLLAEIYRKALEWPEVTVSNDGCLTIAKDEQYGQLLWWYAAPEDCDIEDKRYWRAANPASWVSIDALARQLHDPGLGEQEFRRLHLNQWVNNRNAWLPTGTWAELATEQQIPDRSPIYVGVDVALYHDATAVCWAHPLEDGRLLLNTHVWSCDPNAPAHSHVDQKIELEQVEQFIRQLSRQYQLRELAFDPRFFERSAQLLEQTGITTISFLPASGAMADAYQAFYQHAREGRLAHNNDPILNAHINATAATKTDRGWRIHKLRNKQPIDATIAAVLAVARAQHHQQAKPKLWWLEL